MFAFTRCFCLKKAKQHPGYEDPTTLASETPFTVNEVEALYDLFKKISSSIIDDGFIHKEEFWLALFRNRSEQNLFADRVFDLFDIKRNGVIEFGEFVRSLSIFHPSAPKEDKMEFAFKLYDLRQTGYIERDELKEMVLAILSESDMEISEDVVGSIVDKTMAEADLKGDGKIDKEEWKEFVSRNPTILRNMTLPYLKLKRNRGCRFISSTFQPDMTPESTCFSPIFFNVDIKPSNLKFFWFISHPKYNAKYVVPVC